MYHRITATLSIFVAVMLSGPESLAEPNRNLRVPSGESAIDLFEAAADEQVTLRFIPVDASRGNLLIDNQTNEVLTIKLPSAFAAVPVLAQFGQQGFGQQGQQGGGASQAVGGGPDQGGGGQNFGQGLGQGFGQGQGNRQIGGFMRVAPDRPRKVKAITVCLEHGKPEPNPRIAYTIMPIADYTDDERIAKLCRNLARHDISQNAAQAAAWHLANDLDWNKIAKLNRVESKYLGNIRFFSSKEIDTAKTFTESFAPPIQSVSEAAKSSTGQLWK